MIFNTCSPSMADEMRYANGKHDDATQRGGQKGVTRVADRARIELPCRRARRDFVMT